MPGVEEMWVAAAVNTKWLGKCSAAMLAAAAGSMAEWLCEPDQENSGFRKKVTDSLASAWETVTVTPGDESAPAQDVEGAKEPAIRANVDLVRVVMATTEVYLLAVRKAIGVNSMWEGPASEGYDDFGPVVLGA